MDLEDLPLLGEPLAIELANTLYGDDDDRFDFLGEKKLAALWLTAAGIALGQRLGRDLPELRATRNAIHALLFCSVDAQAPAHKDLSRLNFDLQRAPSVQRLVYSSSASLPRFALKPRESGSRLEIALHRLAQSAVNVLASDRAQDLRRCAAPDCSMLFLKSHHLRRFCHQSCSHRGRQALYYRRQQACS